MHVCTHRQSDRQIDSVTRHYEVMHVTRATRANTTSQMLLHTHMRYYRHYCTFLDPVTGDRPPENPYELAATLTLQIRALRLRLRVTYYQYTLRRCFDLRFDPTAFASLHHYSRDDCSILRLDHAPKRRIWTAQYKQDRENARIRSQDKIYSLDNFEARRTRSKQFRNIKDTSL